MASRAMASISSAVVSSGAVGQQLDQDRVGVLPGQPVGPGGKHLGPGLVQPPFAHRGQHRRQPPVQIPGQVTQPFGRGPGQPQRRPDLVGGELVGFAQHRGGGGGQPMPQDPPDHDQQLAPLVVGLPVAGRHHIGQPQTGHPIQIQLGQRRPPASARPECHPTPPPAPSPPAARPGRAERWWWVGVPACERHYPSSYDKCSTPSRRVIRQS